MLYLSSLSAESDLDTQLGQVQPHLSSRENTIQSLEVQRRGPAPGKEKPAICNDLQKGLQWRIKPQNVTQDTYKNIEAEIQFLNLVNMVGLWQRDRVW